MANNSEAVANVVLALQDGVAHIEQGTPLTRLHYFDGKFLRADALTLEQDYHRTLVRLANLAGGWGVVHGLGIGLSGANLTVGAGLAITPAGSTVLSNQSFSTPLADLLKTAKPAPPGGNAAFGHCDGDDDPATAEAPTSGIYEITVGPLEGLCGNEAVYGKLCEDACVTDSQRPYWREGLVLRLRPITLSLADSGAAPAEVIHLRNRVASAYFAAEPWLASSLLSAAGLAGGVWCNPAQLYGRDEVPIGLLMREGTSIKFIDAWSARRERMDTQARGYWQGRMAMRPWNVFIAQILQFQCQLSGLFEAGQPLPPADDCDQLRKLLDKTRKELESMLKRYGESTKKILMRTEGKASVKEIESVANHVRASYAELDGLTLSLADAGLGQGALPRQRMLLRAGFFELPPAGYLPVDPKTPVEDQCARMFGEGVHLHYHAVRKDEIGHLVEEAQHLDRISLTRGLDNPAAIERVEIFVPDGLASDAQPAAAGTWWRTELDFRAVLALMKVAPAEGDGQQPTQAPTASPTGAPTTAPSGKARKAAASAKAAQEMHRAGFAKGLQSMALGRLEFMFDGLTRGNKGEESGYAFTLVVVAELKKGAANGAGARIAIYIAGDIGSDPFDLDLGGETGVKAELRMAAAEGSGVTLGGTLTVLDLRANGGEEERLVQLDIHAIEGTAGVPPTTQVKRMRLHLRRGGDASTGIFLIDDDKDDPSSSPVLFDWDESPRQAAMYIAAEEDGGKDAAANDAPLPDQRVMNLTGLAAMPAPASAIGAATMSALAGLAEATDDPAFLLRARRRMFPTLEAPKTQTVRALHDWVMFRRARTHLCAPACAQPMDAAFEAFQVWHLRLEDAGQAQALAEALDKGDEKTLNQFDFKKVGILRYRGESSFSEEQAGAVLGMWTPAQPGPKVLLGRVWEGEPTAGQGWQNHFRVRNMLDQIASLTEPPPRGDSSIAAIPLPSPKLGDSALDGGMLIVTSGQLKVRKGLAVLAPFDPPNHHPNKESPHAPFEYGGGDTKALQEFIKSLPEDQPGGLTLATVQALDLPDAQKRLDAVVDLMVAMGRSNILQGHRQVMKLSAFDHEQLVRALEVKPEDYDDILFFEPVFPG
ncbi:PT domain-containing protein [Pseudoduganella namucuonensis]|uniref:Uncharacterized protein n=1 Tax=Pseudoduganella namucuonensis TaxID=1035707 RepID=A0A1I7M4S9_9BURK|nr:PT domain-containing protein [Pseudoduganella namucuonensis]SFV16956.1 hypothetical protein SAMN05216552_10579 [Pseudoduganella namucuonensis]